ncbi:SRPBCC family protein [Pelagicoccus sp. SDUM812005]|uniref:SRPBCC family protein n=1 Tax=Pelagicoccus sp. SDUM812005 TaxID=3041257 RepID=UPI00280D03AC|nr:SRPBCC family protein [Pelagicoccus sp. SDUM812005]MDQ8182101.1 SRPBCC family protein [Pelagicoccus sp. SDUM812005]
MRKFFLVVFSVFSLLFVAAIVLGFFLSKEFTVSRSIVVQASPEKVYSLVGDLEQWPVWGPWKDADEALQVTLGEQTKGVGASQSWVGTDGDGRLVFTEADPERGVTFDLLFNEDAFANTSSITYDKSPNGLVVTWQMAGEVPAPVVGGYLAWMMPDMIAPMFDHGLAKLKAAAEAAEG